MVELLLVCSKNKRQQLWPPVAIVPCLSLLYYFKCSKICSLYKHPTGMRSLGDAPPEIAWSLVLTWYALTRAVTSIPDVKSTFNFESFLTLQIQLMRTRIRSIISSQESPMNDDERLFAAIASSRRYDTPQRFPETKSNSFLLPLADNSKQIFRTYVPYWRLGTPSAFAT